MSSEDTLYSPLLARLRSLQESQKKWRTISDDLLLNMRSPQEYSDHSEQHKSLEATDFEERAGNSSESQGILESDVNSLSEIRTEPENGECRISQENRSTNFQIFASNAIYNPRDEEDNMKEIGDIHHDVFPKFGFLKKGEGTSRYKQRKLKGFKKVNKRIRDRKDNGILKTKKNHHQELSTHSDLKASSKETGSGLEGRCSKKSNFEKLEELTERESFCSTSSKVVELLRDESSSNSTPVTSRISFFGTLESTPLGQKYRNSNGKVIINGKSPIRKLFPSSVNSGSPLPISFVPSHSESQMKGEETTGLKGECPVVKNNVLGILKKTYCSVTPTQKVKFLEKGVRVLEYDKDDGAEERHDSLVTCSDDTDLISVSDLENLALLNYNVNVIYENTLSDDSTEKVALDGKKCKDGIRTDENYHSNEYVYKSGNSLGAKSEIENSLDIKTHKALLLSKVHDLNKEIRIFESKNKAMEQLISELEIERQKLLENSKPKTGNNIKPSFKPKKKVIQDNSLNPDPIFLQIQELQKKLQNLEIENSRLRVKVVSLEKNQRELNKKQSIEMKGKDSDKNGSISLNTKGKLQKPLKCKVPVFNSKIKRNDECGSVQIGKYSNVCSESKSKTLRVKDTILANSSPSTASCRIRSSINIEDYSEDTGQTHDDSNQPFNRKEDVEKLEDSYGVDIPGAKHSLSTICEENLEERSSLSSIPSFLGTISQDYLKARKLKTTTDTEDVKLIPPQTDGTSIEIIDVPCKTVPADTIQEQGKENGKCVYYSNGDKEIIYTDRTVYHYAENQTIHTVFKDNSREEFEFSNGQKEIYFKDSSYQVIFPDSSSKSVYKDGSEICVWKDGTVVRIDKEGIKYVHFPNGQKEIHQLDSVRRIYPDGTIKILHSDGRQETRYKNGKIRIKDSNGNVTVYR